MKIALDIPEFFGQIDQLGSYEETQCLVLDDLEQFSWPDGTRETIVYYERSVFFDLISVKDWSTEPCFG